MIIKGAQPAIGALLSIQPVTSLTSLIRFGTCVESTLRSWHFPTLAAIAGPINNNSSNNHHDGTRNRDSAPGNSEQHTIAYVEPPVEPAIAASQPDSFPLEYAHSFAHTTHTATVEPVHHVAPARQRLPPGQRRPRRAESAYTPLAEPLSVIFPQVESHLRLPAVRPSPNPPPGAITWISSAVSIFPRGTRWITVSLYGMSSRA